MFTIEDAIKDERFRAEKKRELAEAFQDMVNKESCMRIAAKHDQYAAWFEELVLLRKEKEEASKEADE